MRITALLILLLSLKKPTIASAQLVGRQQEGAWPDWDVGDLILNGINLFRGLGDPPQSPQDSDSSNTNPEPATNTPSDQKTSPDSREVAPTTDTPSEKTSQEPTLDSSPSPDTLPAGPVYKINVNKDSSPPSLLDLRPDPALALPSVSEKCDLMNIIDTNCGKIIDQLVFTSSCADIDPNQAVSDEANAQNQAIREKLAVMDGQNTLAGRRGPGLRTSMSNLCGPFLFAVPLTEAQIQEIEKQPGVKSVTPNQDLYLEDRPAGSGLEDSDPAKPPVLTAPGSRLQERDQIINDPLAWDDLRFISTPQSTGLIRNPKLSSAYSYHSNAGQGVTILAVDSGVNSLHDEFVSPTGESSLLADPIIGMDTEGLADDYDDFGTCRVSKMVGHDYGVAKRAKVMVIKVARTMGSLLDVMVKVINYLHAKNQGGETTGGYYVMSMSVQWDPKDSLVSNNAFEGLLRRLEDTYQLVVVVQAGIDSGSGNADIIRWPAVTASRRDIIVVGAVSVWTGRTYDFSRGGPFLRVTAPGSVRCAANRAGTGWMRVHGTDVGMAQVTGLVAYLLSDDDIGPYLRRFPRFIPRWVRNYIEERASYKRLPSEEVPAIWNRLGAVSYV